MRGTELLPLYATDRTTYIFLHPTPPRSNPTHRSLPQGLWDFIVLILYSYWLGLESWFLMFWAILFVITLFYVPWKRIFKFLSQWGLVTAIKQFVVWVSNKLIVRKSDSSNIISHALRRPWLSQRGQEPGYCQLSGHCLDQSEASIQVTWSQSTNQRSVVWALLCRWGWEVRMRVRMCRVPPQC